MNKISFVITDSNMKAGDNGEFFYEYVMNNYKDIKLYFLISKKSDDYNRLIKKGFNVVDIDDTKIFSILRDATVILYSKCQKPMTIMYKIYRNKCVFLNHGIESLNSVSKYLCNNISPRAKYIICASNVVCNNLKKYFNINNSEIIPVGLARWDSLIYKQKKHKNERPHILITFHWRNTELNKNELLFRNSDYLKNINLLLNDDKVKIISQKCDIIFMYHSMFSKYKKYFKVPKYIKYGSDVQFQDMLVDADAIITDFSSNAYEMAVIGKPTFYYIPDVDYVIDKCLYNVNNIKKNSIGKYCNDVNELIETINQFINGEFELSELAKKNIDKIFGDIDTNNCERIYNFICDNIIYKKNNISYNVQNKTNNIKLKIKERVEEYKSRKKIIK